MPSLAFIATPVWLALLKSSWELSEAKIPVEIIFGLVYGACGLDADVESSRGATVENPGAGKAFVLSPLSSSKCCISCAFWSFTPDSVHQSSLLLIAETQPLHC